MRAEPLLVSIDAQGALALTPPQSDLFGPGGDVGLALQYPLTPLILIGARFHAGLLSKGNPPTAPGEVDPGLGSFELLHATLRIRPFATRADVRRSTGLFLEGGIGGGVTGKLLRSSFEGGIGYGFAIGAITLAPIARYLQIIQPADVLSGEDARLALLGVELTFNDARPTPPKPPAPAPRERDRDHDGIDDAYDKCPDQPEDLDGFQDQDGCPDPDNDGDGIPDAKDKCPNQAEDFDGFEDEDGCPDPDNDHDGFLDADDQCPNEPEVINGNKDFDGCPDEGLIEMKNDRIVLEERVLFDFERARVKHEARPILQAIVRLKEQHPEWVSLRVEGHSDARGNARYNQELSEERAQNVMKALIKLGIPESQIHAVGYGATRLRDKGTSEEAHQRNRRVEFVVETRVPVTQQPGAASTAQPAHKDESGAKPAPEQGTAPPSAATPAHKDESGAKPAPEQGTAPPSAAMPAHPKPADSKADEIPAWEEGEAPAPPPEPKPAKASAPQPEAKPSAPEAPHAAAPRTSKAADASHSGLQPIAEHPAPASPPTAADHKAADKAPAPAGSGAPSPSKQGAAP